MPAPKNRQFEFQHFVLQKYFVEKNYPSFICTLNKGILTCIGEITPEDRCRAYRIKLVYEKGYSPKCWVTSPIIKDDAKIHMYRDKSLCLYDHRTNPWHNNYNIHETIIPWIAEWLVLYELYLVFDKWLGPEATHGTIEAPDR